MAKDTRDTQTLDAFPAKPSRGRPRKADALSNAERQRLYRQRQAGKAPQVDADALVRLQNEFDRHVDDARALVAHGLVEPADEFGTFSRVLVLVQGSNSVPLSTPPNCPRQVPPHRLVATCRVERSAGRSEHLTLHPLKQPPVIG